MAQQIDLSGDGGVLKQIVAEGAGPQVCAIPPCVCACACGLESRMRIRNVASAVSRRRVVRPPCFQVESGQTVFAHYTGKLLNGEVFDSTSGKPHRQKHGFYFTPGAGEVIQGWDVVR